jgi:hypothetical protein
MLNALFTKPRSVQKQKPTSSKNTKKNAALTNLKRNLNSCVMCNMKQSYKNNYFENKNDKLIKRFNPKLQKPHEFTRRPYTENEKKEILKIMAKKPVNNIYQAGMIERLNMLNSYIGIEHQNTINAKLKNIDSLIPEKQRKILVKLLTDFIRRKKLVIYGGIALNKYIDKRFDLYPEANSPYLVEIDSILPDFDVFSMNAFEDAKEFIHICKKNGFSKLSIKRAKHDNTWKISVNHFQFADFTIPDSPIPYKEFQGIRYATVDFLKAGLYKAAADPSGGYFRWKKDALRLEKLQYSENKYIRKHGRRHTYFSKNSPYQRFISEYYGPMSKASFKSQGNKKWENKKAENAMKAKFDVKAGNELKINGKVIKMKEPKVIQVLNIPKDGRYVPWQNNKASYKLN